MQITCRAEPSGGTPRVQALLDTDRPPEGGPLESPASPAPDPRPRERSELRQFGPHQVLQFVEELLLVLQIPVHGRKPYIRDLVQIPQVVHQVFSYFYSRYLPVRGIAYLGLHPIDEFGELRHPHWPLFASLQ